MSNPRGPPLVRIFEPVTAETVLAHQDIVLYEYACEKSGQWKWSLGTIQKITYSQSRNASIVVQDWVLPSSTPTSRMNSYTNSPAVPSLMSLPSETESSLKNGVQFTTGKSITTTPRSSVFAKFKAGIAQPDQPILLSKNDLSQIGQLLRLRRRAADNRVNSEELMAMVQTLLRETAQREEVYQHEMRESLSDQFKQLVQLMELQALTENSRQPHSTRARSASISQHTPEQQSFSSVSPTKLKLEQAKISALELVVRDEEGSRLALLKDEAYQAMDLVMFFFRGNATLADEPTNSSAPTVNQAAVIESLRCRLRARQDIHLEAVEQLQRGVNQALERTPESILPDSVKRLISVVDSAVDLLARDGCEEGIRAPTPIPDDARRQMALRFAGVRSRAGSRAASRERASSLPREAPPSGLSHSFGGAGQSVNPYNSPSPAAVLGKPPTRETSLQRGVDASGEWNISERSLDSRIEEQDQAISKLRAQLENERDMRANAPRYSSQMSTQTDNVIDEIDDATPFNETIALQRRMMQQLQIEVAKRMEFLNVLEEQLRTMRRSKHELMNRSRRGVSQPNDDTEELYSQLNRRIAILQTQRDQIQQEVRGREKEIRSMKALLVSAVALTSKERRGGSYRRTSDDLLTENHTAASDREVVSADLE